MLVLCDKNTSWRKRVELPVQKCFMEVLAKMRSPVVVIEKDKVYWVWLHIDGKVAQVGNGVEDSLDEDDDAGHLVDVDVVLKREDSREANPRQQGDCFTQHEN